MDKVILILLLIANIFFALLQISRFVEDDHLYHLLIASANAAAVGIGLHMLRKN